MRIKIIEGMALAKPIIATGIAAEGISYTKNKDIVIADTVNEFILSIHKMIDEVIFTNKIGRDAKKMIETNYDNQIIVCNLLTFFKELQK